MDVPRLLVGLDVELTDAAAGRGIEGLLKV